MDVDNTKFVLAGVNDPSRERIEEYNQEIIMEEKFTDINSRDSYKILLAHRPEKIEEYKKYNFDLVVLGHAHGDQMRIPYILNGLYSPGQGFS